ncbi:hypothetical protein CPB85DRAFT_1514317 [Mucidula mucida]|nr:hypothetical protein CPB85DRAFT_1514317 [Mucidula mucida]
MSDALEARALIGLYNISSNTSVQSIVLQAMSALPLELFSATKAGIPDVAQRICMLVESMEYTAPEKQTAYERLYRVHVRIEPPIPEYGFVPPNVLTPSLTRAVRGPNTLSLLVSRKSPEHAIAFCVTTYLSEAAHVRDSMYLFGLEFCKMHCPPVLIGLMSVTTIPRYGQRSSRGLYNPWMF